MDYIAQPKDYWIATNAINITRNALGKPNRIQCSVASGAAILCYIEGVTGLGYDNGHRFRTWPLTISPTYFNSNTEKYVYVAIPRSVSVGTRAVVVFPSEQLDVYGVNADDEQVGSTDYYYIWLQGIITATDGMSNREWQQTIDFGKKGTDEDLYDDTSSEWFQYSKVNEVVTFLKNIRMKAGTTFQNLILGNKELTGVATSNTAYTDSDVLVATPGYVESQYLSKKHESTAQEQVGFMKGLWVKAKNLFGIDASGNAKLNSVTSGDIHSDGYSDDTLAGSGYHVYKDANGNGHVCTDILDVRMKARFAELEIRKLSYINAEQVQSEAASKLEIVLPVAASGTVLNGSFSGNDIAAYRCMVLADDGTMATKNGWKLGDQARCQTFNITAPGDYTNIESRLYWRLVVRVGQCMDDGTVITEQTDLTDYIGKIHHFFDLANLADLTCDPTTRKPNEGVEFAEFFSDTLTTGNAYHGMMTQNYNGAGADDLAVMATQEWNDVPAADDDVVQMGSQTDETRMGFFVTKADGLHTGPYIYAGVNQFSLVGKMITKITPQEVLISARKLQVFSDPNAGDASPLTHYRGDWTPGSTSYYYDEWDYQGSRWLCIYNNDSGTDEAPGTTAERWKKINLQGNSDVTVYTRGATQPPAPIDSSIPPNGWSTDPTKAIYGVIPGNSIDDNFVRHTIHFTTTQAAQTINVWFIASSEANYDFIICGEIDESVTARPAGIGGVSDAAKAVQEQYHAASGRGSKIFYLQAGQAGEHTLDVCFTKDGSDEDDEDCGYYWITGANFGSEQLPIWASKATFNGDTKISGWSTPVRWNGQDGENGASPIIADLDNEMDSVACDASGHPVQISSSNQVVTTNVSLMNGTTSVTPTIVVKDTNSEGTQYTSGTTAANGIKVTITNSKKIDVEFTTSATINGKKVFYISLSATINGTPVTRELYFTVNGVLPGANGEPATLYQIIPSQDKMAFSRLSSGGLTPDNQYLTFTVKKTVGNETTIIHTAQLEQNNLIARYSTSDPPASKTSGVAWGVRDSELEPEITFNNIGNAVISKNVTFQQIYIALFGSDGTLHDRETIPVIKDGANGADGNDGNDGEDGLDAWTLTVNPNPIIIEQNIEDGSFPFSTNSPLYIDMTAKCGDNAATVGTPSNPSSNGMGLTVNAVNSGNHRLSITAYNKDSQTNKYITNGYITCDVPLSYGTRSTTMAVRIQVGVNLLGEWETKIVGDAETSVATKLTNAVIDGEINTFQQVGTYIRSASENTAKLTETVSNNSIANEKNLFGFTRNISYDGAVPFVQGYGFVATYDNSQQYGRIYNIKLNDGAGYYVVSCEIKVQTAGKIRLRLGDWDPVSGNILVSDGGVLKVPATTSWQKVVAVFNLTAAQAADSNGALVIRGGSSSNNVFIRYLQIERGSTPSLFGICADDAANNSEPMHVTWNQSPESGMFSDETSGNYGPGGTTKYTTNRVYPSSNPQYPQNTGYIELIKGDLVMTEGVYTLSFWARANANGSVMECQCYDETNTETHKGVVAYCDGLGMEYGEIDPNQTEGMSYWGSTRIKLTTAWKKYYVHWYMTGASSKIRVIPIRINGADTGGSRIDYYIAQIKLERGYVTSASRTVYETVMKQTARRMDFSVLVNSMEKAGIHLYTESNGTPENEAELAKGVIDLVAGKVKFKNAAGTVDDKVWIDTTYGTLHAVNGDFSGKIHAVEGDFTDITSQDEHVAIVGTPNSTNNYWRGLAVGDDPVNGDGDLATIGGRFTNASASTGYGYLVIAKNTGSGSLSMVTINGNDGSVGCVVLKAHRIETNLRVVTGNHVCDSGSFTDSKVVCNYSGTGTIKLPVATTPREIWVRQIGTGTTNVYDDTGTNLVGSVTKADGWKLFVYIPQTGIGWK